MSLPRFLLEHPAPLQEGCLLRLGPEVARHLKALRLGPGAAIELLVPVGAGHAAWKADLAELGRDQAQARLVAPVDEDREPPIALEAWLPLTAHLPLWDDWLPPLVELGVTRIVPVVYARSEHDARKTGARRERWERLIRGACEQSHRAAVPVLENVVPFSSLEHAPAAQRWVAYELPTGERNPDFARAPLAFTCGPEGGITDGEIGHLRTWGWRPVTLGRSILRAVTCPVALLGAAQYQLGR